MLQESFSPVSGSSVKVLILGSMPGKASLQQQQYYAHPRNSFWPIMCDLLSHDHSVSADSPYAKRLALLKEYGIALWDVMHSCLREGSLDSAIQETSIVANDFAHFYDQYKSVNAVFFNGAKAEQTYHRHVTPLLSQAQRALPAVRLPSTSPAHAAMNFEAKLAAWQAIRDHL